MRFKNYQIISAAILLIAITAGCRQKSVPVSNAAETGSVFFNIETAKESKTETGEVKTWLASYDSGGKKARFRIELAIKKPKGDPPFAFGTGVFYREPDSDSSILLQNLAKALEAKGWTTSATTTNKLEVNTAILGEGLSRGNGKDVLAGAFTSDPKGDWLVTKIFVGDGNSDGEFYLNLNSKLGKGEFSIKDSEYGDVVLRELSRVF